jgi:hypothetical protein
MNEWDKFIKFATLYHRRDKYNYEINELEIKGKNIGDSELVKLWLLVNTVNWYDRHIKFLEKTML